MNINEFDFHLPAELIARFPLPRREESRLMVVSRKDRTICHHRFQDLPRLLSERDFLVVNDSRVIAGKLFGFTGSRPVEVTVIRRLDPRKAEVLARPARHLKPESRIDFENGLAGRVIRDCGGGRRWVEFSRSLEEILKSGYAPLPPYIKRRSDEARRHRRRDLIRYQTVYHREGFSIAAPTAGLHFSRRLISRIRKRHPVVTIRLDVGETTFQKIEVQDIREHKMGKETVYIDEGTGRDIEYLKLDHQLVAVGTTTVRALETYTRLAHRPARFESEIYIYPGFEFWMVDRMITNFHLPRSSLFVLVCAFAGRELMRRAYREAIKEKYRFYSYGDAMLIK